MKNLFLTALLIIFTSCSALFVPAGYQPITPASNTPLSNIYKRYDEFRELTFYQHNSLFPVGSIKHSIVGYVVKSPENVTFRTQFNYFSIRTSYSRATWIFFDRVILMSPDKGLRLELKLNSSESQRDVTSSGLSESYDIILTKEEYDVFKNIFSGGAVKCAYYGEGRHEFEYTEKGIIAIREMINFYESL